MLSGKLTNKFLEWELANKKLGTLKEASDFTKGNVTLSESMVLHGRRIDLVRFLCLTNWGAQFFTAFLNFKDSYTLNCLLTYFSLINNY